MFSKQATDEASSLSLLAWRFLIAFIGMSLLVIFRVMKINLKGKKAAPVLVISLFCPVIYFIGETVGISYTTSVESGVFISSIPVACLIGSALILKKRPSKQQVAGIGLTLAGVLITMFALGTNSSFSIIGYIFLFIAVISYALYGVFVDKAVSYTSAEITYVMIISGMVVFASMALIEALLKGNMGQLIRLPFQSRAFLISVIYQGWGCSIVAFFLSNIAIATLGLNKMVSFSGLTTVVSIFAGTVFMKESFTSWQLMGAGIIVAGVYVANIGTVKEIQEREKNADKVKSEIAEEEEEYKNGNI